MRFSTRELMLITTIAAILLGRFIHDRERLRQKEIEVSTVWRLYRDAILEQTERHIREAKAMNEHIEQLRKRLGE